MFVYIRGNVDIWNFLKKSCYLFANLKLLNFVFSTQTLSISQAQYCTSFAFAPPITIKSVTLIVFLTLESCQSLLSLFAGNVCFLWIYFLLVNYDPISQHVSVLWQHPLSLPSTRHNLIAPLTRININISLSDINFILVYCGACRHVTMSQFLTTSDLSHWL